MADSFHPWLAGSEVQSAWWEGHSGRHLLTPCQPEAEKEEREGKQGYIFYGKPPAAHPYPGPISYHAAMNSLAHQ